MQWGEDPVLEKHYVPRRSQRTRSVLTSFAEDAATCTLLYANADLSKASQSREVIAFADQWKNRSRRVPRAGAAGFTWRPRGASLPGQSPRAWARPRSRPTAWRLPAGSRRAAPTALYTVEQ
jgi:hypothetical protein